MWQTVAQTEKQRGEPVLEQQQPCQVWESTYDQVMGALDGISRKKLVSSTYWRQKLYL